MLRSERRDHGQRIVQRRLSYSDIESLMDRLLLYAYVGRVSIVHGTNHVARAIVYRRRAGRV